jgi:hypothetical protein
MSRSVQSGQPYPAVAHRSVLPVQAGIARAAPAAPFSQRWRIFSANP